MRNNYIVIIGLLFVLFTACEKENTPVELPAESISINYPAQKDTLEMPLSILKDSTIIIGLKAALAGQSSSADHWVKFAVDTTKIVDYRARYGTSALLLPTSAYLFYKSMAVIAAGANLSDSAVLNIGQQTKLKEYSTYVLPVVIQSVDGKAEGAVSSKVLYVVLKTGKPLFINKEGWTIAGVSSQQGTFLATNLLDNNTTTTYWTSSITAQMPQWVAFNFNKEVTYTAVNYYLPTALVYPTQGGYPTSIRIETSMDGASWTSKGEFVGNVVNKMQTLDIGNTTSRYLRFTSLAAVKYASAYDCIFISDISLVP